MTTAAATVHVTRATIIPGTIGETASVTPVVSPTGGKVAQVLVKDGQDVAGQQDLFILEDDGLAEQRAALADQLAATIIKDARITAELADESTVQLPDELTNRASEAAIVDALQLEQEQLTTDAESLDAATQALEAQQSSEETSLTSLKQEQATATQRATDPAFTGAPASAYAPQIAAANAQMTQISAQIDQTRSAAKANLLGLATENQTTMSNLRSQVELADKQLGDLYIKAPAPGTVSNSILTAPGQYLPPYEAAMNLVGDGDGDGDGDGLVITAQLPVSDAPFASDGDNVTIDLTTGDKLKTTSVTGTIENISASPSSKGKSAAAYAVRIIVSPEETGSVRSESALVNGMPAQVHVESGSQSILNYLVSPVVERMRFAFHER